ncbi:MAG: hypothetical protein ACYC3B_00725 [Sedimentisphaerales bacterium]
MNNFSKHIDFEKRRMPDKSGLTVVELLVVIGIIAVVVAISLPAFNAMQKSFDSTGAEGMISAALSTARTLAISKQQYVGVRFQTSYDPADVLDEEQYMIFIIYDADKTDWVCGFRAIGGYKPVKLPSNVGVYDKFVNVRPANCGGACDKNQLTGFIVPTDIVDTMTFSIVFSPAGKLVIHKVGCRRNDWGTANIKDTVFNTQSDVVSLSPTGMFVDDDNTESLGLGLENSRNTFYIYDREKLRKMTNTNDKWDYIDKLPELYINPYTGGIIEK